MSLADFPRSEDLHSIHFFLCRRELETTVSRVERRFVIPFDEPKYQQFYEVPFTDRNI